MVILLSSSIFPGLFFSFFFSSSFSFFGRHYHPRLPRPVRPSTPSPSSPRSSCNRGHSCTLVYFFAIFQGQKVHLGFIYFDCTCICANSSMRKRFNTGREYYLTIFCLNVIIHLTQVAFLVTHFANCWSFLLRRPIFMCPHGIIFSNLELTLKTVRKYSTGIGWYTEVICTDQEKVPPIISW